MHTVPTHSTAARMSSRRSTETSSRTRLSAISTHVARVSSAAQQSLCRSPVATQSTANMDGARSGAGVLSGVTVVEMSMVLAAPMCCALMADMGATVYKVEPPGGEIWRKDGPPAQFQQLNRGKRSVVLDVRKQPEALKALKQLLAKADVFVTNLREPALQMQGLDYDTLRHEFPALVYAHMTAWGRDGPKKDDPGYDIGGFLAATGLQSAARATDDDDLPRNLGGLGDFTSARDLLLGILGGLFHQQRTGEGQLVDACLLRSGIFSMAAQMSQVLDLIARDPPVLTKVHGRDEFPNPTYNAYKCADGGWVQLLGLETRRHLPILLKALGLTEGEQQDWLTTHFDRAQWRHVTVRVEYNAKLDRAFLSRTADEWCALFVEADVWHHKVMDINEVALAPQPNAVGAYTRVPNYPIKQIAHPVKFSVSNHTPVAAAPELGADTRAVLSELQLSQAELEVLLAMDAKG